MSAHPGRPSEPEQTRLRILVARIDAELAVLRGPTPVVLSEGTGQRLRDAWEELIDILSLGAEPERRVCPACGSVGMRAATLCGHCWSRLTPPAVERADA